MSTIIVESDTELKNWLKLHTAQKFQLKLHTTPTKLQPQLHTVPTNLNGAPSTPASEPVSLLSITNSNIGKICFNSGLTRWL